MQHTRFSWNHACAIFQMHLSIGQCVPLLRNTAEIVGGNITSMVIQSRIIRLPFASFQTKSGLLELFCFHSMHKAHLLVEHIWQSTKFCHRWSRSSWQMSYSIHWCLGSYIGVRGSVMHLDTSLHSVCSISVFTTTSLCVYVRAASARPLHRQVSKFFYPDSNSFNVCPFLVQIPKLHPSLLQI